MKFALVAFFLTPLAAALLITSPVAAGPTYISGIITADTVWTEAGNPYIITGDTIVERDITLTIEPGVQVRFDGPYELEVLGAISAIGTSAKPILFTRNREDVRWRRIYTHAGLFAEFEYVIAEYAETGIDFENRSLNLRNRIVNSVFRYNHLGFSAGSRVIQSPQVFGNVVTSNTVGVGQSSSIAYHTITNNASHGVTGVGSISDSVISNNGGDGVQTSGEIRSSTISNNGGDGVQTFGGEIRSSTIENNKGNGVTAFRSSRIRDSNIIGNRGYALRLTTEYDLIATNNWWGTTDPEEIKRLIYDFSDDRLLGKVTFTPYLTAPATIPSPTPTPTPRPPLPTVTSTPTPPGTPLPIATPAATPQNCSWAGQWNTVAGGQSFAMTLAQSGSGVTGTYGSDRRIDGTASGNQLSGRWAGPPTYTEPQNAGRFVFTITSDCNSFAGAWGFNTATADGGAWTGIRVVATPAETVRDAYLATLGRPPDPTGLASWIASGLDWPELLAALRSSPEGLRATAVRGIYIELLGRDPLGADNGGLRAWVGSPLSLEEIRAGIMASGEYQRRQP